MCRSIFGISFNRGRTTIGILDIIIRGEPEKQTAADDSEVCTYDRCNTIVPYRPRSRRGILYVSCVLILQESLGSLYIWSVHMRSIVGKLNYMSTSC